MRLPALLLALFLPLMGFAGKSELYDERELLVLSSPGPQSGMFSVFLTVLGCLHFYDEGEWAALRLDFGRDGLYYDKRKGKNWWEYYFLPVHLEREKGSLARIAVHRQIHRFHSEAFKRMSPERGYELIRKYIAIRPEVERKVSSFARRYFRGSPVIGVHFRGTDKKSEAKRVSFKKVFAAVRATAKKYGWKEYKIFVATDEEQFIQEISAEFKEKIIYTSARRSTDGSAVHFAKENQFEIGEEALIDCLLLARTDFMVRTISNLSYCVRYFNPSLPTLTVKER